ncbi:MAG: carboxypeptidase-like regulatory domain-containing protein [Planctomycetaceae bacterium]|jgi:hypothetical protein|nr:carboxypeptidase-like regulatory domain-containing protein [Planctomycetaceae bacterium]
MNKQITINVTIIMTVVLLCAFGCGNNSSLTGLVPAAGVLRFNGKPVDGATIFFNPVGQTKAASAITDNNGNFTVMTLNPHDGIYSGEYIITVTKIERRGEMRETQTEQSRTPIIHDTREIIEHLPSKYADLETTDLKITIPKNGNKNIVINLTGTIDLTPKKVKDIERR